MFSRKMKLPPPSVAKSATPSVSCPNKDSLDIADVVTALPILANPPRQKSPDVRRPPKAESTYTRVTSRAEYPNSQNPPRTKYSNVQNPPQQKSVTVSRMHKPARLARVSFEQCTHMTTVRMFSKEFCCGQCHQFSSTGWIWRCTQDRELLLEASLETGDVMVSNLKYLLSFVRN